MPRRFDLALLVSVTGMVSAVVATQPQAGRPSQPAAQEYLLQFEGPVQEAWKASVTAAGATLLEYLPDFSFRVRLRPDDAGAVRALPFVRALAPYQAASKVTRIRGDATEQPLLVRLDGDADPYAVAAALTGAGVRVTRAGRSLLMVSARTEQVMALAQVPGVASLEPYVPRGARVLAQFMVGA